MTTLQLKGKAAYQSFAQGSAEFYKLADESAKNTTPHGFTSYTKENNIITVTIPSNAPVDSVVNYYCTNTSHSDMKGSINISFRDIDGKTYEWFYGSMKPTPEINLEVYVTGDFSNADLLGYNVKDGSNGHDGKT